MIDIVDKVGDYKMRSLSEVLGIKEGVIALVGGGGKTTTIFKLAQELSQKGNKVIVTTTTKMFVPKTSEVQQLLINPSIAEIKNSLSQFNCIGIADSISDGKIHGVDDHKIGEMKKLAAYVLVEADGSKCLPIKVPNEHEPVIPSGTDKVVIVVGLKSINQSLGEACFRKEKAMGILGVEESHCLTAKDILKLISSPNGLSKGIENYKHIVMLNQSDTLTIGELNKLKSYFKEEATIPVIVASLQKGRYERIC